MEFKCKNCNTINTPSKWNEQTIKECGPISQGIEKGYNNSNYYYICPVCGEKSYKKDWSNNVVYNEYWYSLTAQIITDQQPELKAVMLEQMSEWRNREIKTIDELTIGEIIGWLIDCQEEINYAGLIK